MLTACDDNTDTLGVSMMPGHDFIKRQYSTYDVKTESYEVGNSVLARSSISYLGRFTDPETNTIVKSDFLAQFRCNEGFDFPDKIADDKAISVQLNLFVKAYVGDSLASFKLSVYPLNKVLDPNKNYYTDIDPTEYYDTEAEPIATKWFTLSDRTITDDQRWDTKYNNNISIRLPNSVGDDIIKAYRNNPDLFSDADKWINSDIPTSKGFYFKLEAGDGAMAYIDVAQYNIYYKYYDEDYKKDTVGISQFASTEEVVQATRFENTNLQTLMDDVDATYIKCPAGIFTMATLPADKVNVNDTINSAKLTLTRYNGALDTDFTLSIPKNVLLVRLDDYLNGFFENYKLADEVTSYMAKFNKSNNTYEFDNIARLITIMNQEKANGTATANWNKVLFIPVEPSTISISNNYGIQQNKIVKLCHDFSMSSARLMGGTTPLKLEVIYSKFGE